MTPLVLAIVAFSVIAGIVVVSGWPPVLLVALFVGLVTFIRARHWEAFGPTHSRRRPHASSFVTRLRSTSGTTSPTFFVRPQFGPRDNSRTRGDSIRS